MSQLRIDWESNALWPVVADVLYDRQNLPLLATAQAHAAEVLVTELPGPGYLEVARIEGT